MILAIMISIMVIIRTKKIMNKLYKIIVHAGSKFVFEFDIKTETKSTIMYYVGGSGATKRLNLSVLDVLDIHEVTYDIAINPVVIYTRDKSKIGEYMKSCIDIYVERIQKDLETRTKQLEKFKLLEWRREQYGK